MPGRRASRSNEGGDISGERRGIKINERIGDAEHGLTRELTKQAWQGWDAEAKAALLSRRCKNRPTQATEQDDLAAVFLVFASLSPCRPSPTDDALDAFELSRRVFSSSDRASDCV